MENKHYTIYGGFDTRQFDLLQVYRDVPSPTEKEVIEDIAYMNGVLDFGGVFTNGELRFDRRTIEFGYQCFFRNVREREEIENEIKAMTITLGMQPIIDSAIPGLYWYGKLSNQEQLFDHDEEYNILSVTLKFSCMPFAFTIKDAFDDNFDDFVFETDYAAWRKFEVAGTEEIFLVNPGQNSISPIVATTAPMKLTMDGVTIVFPEGETKNTRFRLKPGYNTGIVVEGNGMIEFFFQGEVMR
ncbi:distal tail protein Dit [Globicatella sulfidifaciens]